MKGIGVGALQAVKPDGHIFRRPLKCIDKRSDLQDSVTLVNPGVSQLCVRGDGKLLASAGWDHRVRIFGWKKLRPLAVLQYHTDLVLSVAFSDHQDPRQRLLAAGSKDQRISLWSIFNEGADTG
ncbi:hypothetical protein F7725_012339 [Dissostichus mawsoni]|uniref:Uncharacterized protein n=1 Tax=Dissostichus mawsoni TaxID=36200 RepID=A0A7J5YQA1_DISMA|nr:hypothetical protein F7725_012339 [Dissostichus mawsoni]